MAIFQINITVEELLQPPLERNREKIRHKPNFSPLSSMKKNYYEPRKEHCKEREREKKYYENYGN